MIKGHESKRIDEYKQTRMLMFTMVRLMGDPKTAPKTPIMIVLHPSSIFNYTHLSCVILH